MSHSMRDGAFHPAKSIVVGKGLAMALLHGGLLNYIGRRFQIHILAGYGMGIVEQKNVGIGPQRRRRFFKFIGTRRIGGIGVGVVGHIIGLGEGPAFVEIGMPNRTIVQHLHFPYAVLFGVDVFVERAFPPLPERMRFVGELVMAAGLHEDAETRVGQLAVGRNVDDVLQHHVIQQIALYGAVVATGEVFAETAAVKPARAFFAAEDAADEMDLAIVGKQIHHFVVQAFVEIVA